MLIKLMGLNKIDSIVEDDDQFREMSSEWMRRKGHRVQSAANAQEALKHCERQAFDVIIADMNMPGREIRPGVWVV